MAARVHAVGDCERRRVVGLQHRPDGYTAGVEKQLLPFGRTRGALTHHVETAPPSPQRG